jgi:hypothetical protein
MQMRCSPCQDLIGAPLEGLSTTSTPASHPVNRSAGDCAAVDAMIALLIACQSRSAM